MSEPDSPVHGSPVHAGPDGSGELEVQVVPRASRSRIVGLHAGRLKIQLAAPPVDGAANAALVDLLADTLAVARSSVAVVRGQTGKRKTLRILGLAAGELRRRLGLAALLLAAPACESSYDFPIHVVLPLEQDELARADNFAMQLLPQGLDINYEVDGLDFEVKLELEPDDTTSTLGLYLADGPDLLAWGRSAPFVLSNPTADFAVYLSPPGALSTFPGAIRDPDPEMLASPAIGRGMLLLDGDGQTALFNVFTLDTEIGATLKDPAGLPDPADGALVPDSRGNVWRVAWADRLRAHRYAPGDDAWSTPTLTGATAGARPGAAHLQDASRERVLLFGGGEQRSVLELALVPDDDGALVVTALPGELDSPRRGATAAYLVRSDGDAGEGVVLVGGDDPKAPLVFHLGEDFASGGGKAIGEFGAWTGARCMQVDRGEAAERDDYVRMLCVGGVQGGEATTDAIVLNFPPAAADSTPSVKILPGFLPEPAADPRLFADDAAIYAQSGALWLRIDRAELAVEALTGPSPRVRGGHSVLLATGATFLVGGWAADEQPVDHWHVFAPSLSGLSAP